LKEYKGKDHLIASSVNSLIGDCYSDLGETGKAIDYYKKAVSKAKSESLSPIYLKKVATAYESTGDYKEALSVYNTIKTDYPESKEASDIDKYIERAGSLIK
jgi:tetratricopeptide (TPR) repeat protein